MLTLPVVIARGKRSKITVLKTPDTARLKNEVTNHWLSQWSATAKRIIINSPDESGLDT